VNEDEAIKGIRKAAKKRARASEARRAATDELRHFCIAAQEAGVPVSQIAREAGFSRQGVYDLLAERPSR
jgi:DNA invertase Pin-like site-specific DNA recombinase